MVHPLLILTAYLIAAAVFGLGYVLGAVLGRF